MPVSLGKADVEEVRVELKERHPFKKETFPGVRTLFEYLQDAGIGIALASSAEENGLEACKRVADIANSMHEQTSSSNAEKSRPRLRIFPTILDWLYYPWLGTWSWSWSAICRMTLKTEAR